MNRRPEKGSMSPINICFKNATRFGVTVDEDKERLPTFFWLPKLHKQSYKVRFIANSSFCTTTKLSKLLAFCLPTIKILFWSIRHSSELLYNLKSRGFQESNLSTCDFSTLQTIFPHSLIKDNIVDLIENIFQKQGFLPTFPLYCI